jgi:hypothetical protein
VLIVCRRWKRLGRLCRSEVGVVDGGWFFVRVVILRGILRRIGVVSIAVVAYLRQFIERLPRLHAHQMRTTITYFDFLDVRLRRLLLSLVPPVV